MLVVRNRLKLDRSTRVWVAQALSLPGVELVPLDAEVAVAAADLPEFGGDPADRMIVATARHHDANLATADERIADSNLVPIVW